MYYLPSMLLRIPDKVNKVGNEALQDWVLDVQQPTIKAVVGSNVSQLHGSFLAGLLCPQQQLTQQGPICPLCDKGSQHLLKSCTWMSTDM